MSFNVFLALAVSISVRLKAISCDRSTTRTGSQGATVQLRFQLVRHRAIVVVHASNRGKTTRGAWKKEDPLSVPGTHTFGRTGSMYDGRDSNGAGPTTGCKAVTVEQQP